MKIVFNLASLGPGGMEQQFTEQMRFFDRGVFDISLVTLVEHKGAPDLYDNLPRDLPVYRLDFKGFFDIAGWTRFYKLMRKIKPDIVVSSIFFANTVSRLVQPLIGYRSIAREHNTYVDKSLFARLVDRVLARRSSRIVAVSKMVADFTAQQENIPREKFAVIHNGIDSEQVARRLEALPAKEELRLGMGFHPDKKMLLNVARLVPQKNHHLLIEGFARFHTVHPDWILCVVGGGSLQNMLEAYAKEEGVAEAVRFVGHQDDVWKFYKIADAFVSTSDIEGFSNAYLEALATGLPVVATKTAGTDELIRDGENGFFIPERTAEAVSAAMEKVVNADQKRLSEKCVATACTFDIRETVRLYEKLFRAVAAK